MAEATQVTMKWRVGRSKGGPSLTLLLSKLAIGMQSLRRGKGKDRSAENPLSDTPKVSDKDTR